MQHRPTPKAGIMEIAAYTQGKSTAASHKPLIKLSSNESALGFSPRALQAYQDAAGQLHRYPDGQAHALKAAIHDVLGFAPARVVCGAGSDEIIHLLISAFAREGDEVLQSQYGFLMYQIYAKASGATPVFAPEPHLVTDVDALLAAVTERTKIVFIANPNNPTGTYINGTELKRLRQNLPPHVVLVVDEAYVEFVTAGDFETAQNLVESTDNTVLMRTFSKAYGLPGLRIGYGYMPEAIADALNRIRGPFNLSSPAIAAGVAALADAEFLAQTVAHNSLWRARMTLELSAMGFEVLAGQGNFVLFKCGVNGTKPASELNHLLTLEGIILRETTNYGLPDYLRMTIGSEHEMLSLLTVLKPIAN